VFPHHVVGQRGLAHRDVVRQRFGAQQVGAVAGRFKRGDQRFAGVHIGVLAAIAVQVRPVGAGLVGVQAVLRVPEALLHQLKGFVDPRRGLRFAGHQRVAVGQQHEGQAVAVVGAVGDAASPLFQSSCQA
jgi:hypothetical protein